MPWVVCGKSMPPDTFKHDWSHLSDPINAARLKMAVNLASMLFTLGALVHLIVFC